MNHESLSQRQQCKLLGVNRNRLNPRPTKKTQEDQDIMRLIDEIHMKYPFYGQRNIQHELKKNGFSIGRKRTRRLMRMMGVESLAPQPNTSTPNKSHKKYPYLLKNLPITRPNQVWCADITYLPMAKGHVYLVAIMDWYSKSVLSWKISNSMDASFCIEALKEAMRLTGIKPDIFNTDQGSQFTGNEWISCLKENDITISMDGKGRWVDNVFIERLWRSLKYERIRLYSYENVRELREHVATWMTFYNHERPHQSLEMNSPWSIYTKDAAIII
jgi:putative transposase